MKTIFSQPRKMMKFLSVVFFCIFFSTACDKQEYEYSPPEYLKITGATSVTANSTRDYYTFYLDNVSYVWTVPSGATIKSGQGTSHIQILFGNAGGTLSVEAKGMTSSIQVTIL